jgi:hypothetical protein
MVIVQEVGCEAGFPYVIFEVVEVLFISLSENSTFLTNIFHITVRACEAVYPSSFVLLLGVDVFRFGR